MDQQTVSPTDNATAKPLPSQQEQEIDLAVLAQKIFELLKREARLERERSGRY